MKDANSCDFSIDNVVITYQSDQVSTVCSGGNDSYMFGFNGKEKTNEWNGEGCSYDYGFRIYDPRIARFLSVDPISKNYPWYTPYQFAGNTPIQAIDIDGKEEFFVTEYFNSSGELYKTVIQIVSNGAVKTYIPASSLDLQAVKIHWSRVDLNAGGDAVVTYTGSTTNLEGNNAFSNSSRGGIGNDFVKIAIYNLTGIYHTVYKTTGVEIHGNVRYTGGDRADLGLIYSHTGDPYFEVEYYNGPKSPTNPPFKVATIGDLMVYPGMVPSPSSDQVVYMDPTTNAVPKHPDDRNWAIGITMSDPKVGGINELSGKPLGNGSGKAAVVNNQKSEEEILNVPGADDGNSGNNTFSITTN